MTALPLITNEVCSKLFCKKSFQFLPVIPVKNDCNIRLLNQFSRFDLLLPVPGNARREHSIGNYFCKAIKINSKAYL